MSLADDHGMMTERRLIGAIWFVLLIGLATIAAAWYFQLVLGYLPCELCLYQRIPYYVALPILALALAVAIGGGSPAILRAALVIAGLAFLTNAGLGAFHAGVEWKFWAGPASCAGATGAAPANAGDLLSAVKATRVVSCTDAAWRLFGISMAGWNAVISVILAGVALTASSRRD